MNLLRLGFIILLISVVFTSCKKDKTPAIPTLPQVTTNEISTITASTAIAGGTITGDANASVTDRGVVYSASQTADPHALEKRPASPANGIGSFTVPLTNLNFSTAYYVWAYFTNAEGMTTYGDRKAFTTFAAVDADGNNYHAVTIGTQVWMLENLKVTQYNDGSPIPQITLVSEWTTQTNGAYCNYANNNVNGTTYGKLYNWHAVNSGKLCPAGWRIPTEADWDLLISFLGGESSAGGQLKSTNLWTVDANGGATNLSGFTALPAGYRQSNGGQVNLIFKSRFWTATTDVNGTLARYYELSYDTPAIVKGYSEKTGGFSVRCIKNN